MTDEPLVLGIETSCDETGVGIVRGHTLLADTVASSVEEHARFGGVVPEVASRAHLEAMVPTIERAAEPVDRATILDAFFDTRNRDSVLGTYSIDELGDTTLNRLAGYRVRDGRPVFDARLGPP